MLFYKLFYKIASILSKVSLDERHFLSEYKETFDNNKSQKAIIKHT